MLIKLFITPQIQTVDAAGRTVLGALEQIGHKYISKIAIGRFLEIQTQEVVPEAQVAEYIAQMCNDVRLNIFNPVMEDYTAEVTLSDGRTLSIKGERQWRKKK